MSIPPPRNEREGLQRLVADMNARISALERMASEKDTLLKETAAELAAVRSRVDRLAYQNIRAARIMVSLQSSSS